MPTATEIETADRLTRRRARMLPALALIFIFQQAAYFAGQLEDGSRTVDQVKIGAWLILSVVILLALATGGFWFKPARVRALMDDEVTRAHRTDAFRIGFVVTMLGGTALYVVTLFEPIGRGEAIHLLMTFGLAAALLRFGYLERRALKYG